MMENESVVVVEKERVGVSPWKSPKGKRPIIGQIEKEEMMRASIIDTNVSIRENIERNWKNYLYY